MAVLSKGSCQHSRSKRLRRQPEESPASPHRQRLRGPVLLWTVSLEIEITSRPKAARPKVFRIFCHVGGQKVQQLEHRHGASRQRSASHCVSVHTEALRLRCYCLWSGHTRTVVVATWRGSSGVDRLSVTDLTDNTMELLN